MKKIGLTTTIPIEVILAKDYTPVDLNNLFITDKKYLEYIDFAENDGFPKNTCAWIKGMYGACIFNNIKDIVGVVEGDCSNTKSLIEVLSQKGVTVYPFSFPHSHSLKDLTQEIDKFIKLFNTNIADVENVRIRLGEVRELAKKIDRLTYIQSSKATGFENHLYQLSTSDFNSNFEKYKNILQNKIIEISQRSPSNKKIRLGFIGVPPIHCDIYDFVENLNAKFIYNEVQREFAFPRWKNSKDIYSQYLDYTYPYNINFRLSEIKKQIEERNIHALIHYTQAFCYKGIDDIVIRKNLDIPILSIEGDKLNKLDARTKLRLEAFLDMLSDTITS